jgi:hypothetical protein
VLITDTYHRGQVGVSLCGSLSEAVPQSDALALRKVIKSEFKRGEECFCLFIYRLVSDTLLSTAVRLSRDREWLQEDASPSPIGHHTINSTYGEPNGAEFSRKLNVLNQQFGSSVLKLVYVVCELGSLSVIWVLQRSVVEKCEAWDDSVGDFDVVQVVQP